jgi:hypothetical protein
MLLNNGILERKGSEELFYVFNNFQGNCQEGCGKETTGLTRIAGQNNECYKNNSPYWPLKTKVCSRRNLCLQN